MNAIIVSDLHIGSHYFQCQAFKQFLEELGEDQELILNGDVVDSPYAKMEPSHQQILDWIERLSLRQKVVWIRGNHDNGYMPKNFGRIEFKHQYTIENRLLIAHGDDFDEIMPRSRWFIKAFKFMHNLRVKLGANPVHVAEYAKKWKAFYRVLRKNVALNAVKCATENGFAAVTCGHTHYAEETVINGTRYLNTGAWTELPAYYLQVSAEDLVLNRYDPSSLMSSVKLPASNHIGAVIPCNEAPCNPTKSQLDISEIPQ